MEVLTKEGLLLWLKETERTIQSHCGMVSACSVSFTLEHVLMLPRHKPHLGRHFPNYTQPCAGLQMEGGLPGERETCSVVLVVATSEGEVKLFKAHGTRGSGYG